MIYRPHFLPPSVLVARPGVTNLPSDAALLLGLSWWMWVIIGVGGLIVVLLMVLVICLCKKVRRRKVSVKDHSGNLHMLLCRCRFVVGIKRDGSHD